MSSLGLNNYGAQVYRYGLEDTDVDEKGEEVFRESDSTFFCRVRDLFPNELKSLYNTLESQNAWHAESFINKADEWQSEFPEELWRLDIDRKYIRTYNSSFINGEGDSQFLVNMSNGKMKYHRRQWERNQEKYMASKYQTAEALNDSAVLRCTSFDDESKIANLAVKPNYKLKLTPYAYMYLNVSYGTQGTIQMRAEPNIEYEIPFEGTKADIINIYSSPLLQSLGDLSSCYPATVDTTKASKIKELIIGNKTEGYDNPYLTTLTTGANYLLEVLNVENVSGLTQSLNLSALNNLRELYAHGSNASGVTFADGGKIEIAELPAINAISMKNLVYLTTLDITDFSKLTTLTVENCNMVDLISILKSAPNVNRVRITGIDWALEDTSLLESIYKMAGIDRNGYNADQSVLAGHVHVPVIRQQQLSEYSVAWPDLEVTFDSMIEQRMVTFVNHDGTVLEVQYVDVGEDAVDPTKRADNPIPIPTRESTVSTNFAFAGWDTPLAAVFDDRTIMAIYSESARSYTIKYVSRGYTSPLQTSTGLYGENVVYTGITPIYTQEERAYKYYLFNRWDKSGFIDGDKTVTAIFDEFQYDPSTPEGSFANKELKDMTPVQIYALTRLLANKVNVEHTVSDLDAFSFEMGHDVDYNDIDSYVLVQDKVSFDGSNQLDFDGSIPVYKNNESGELEEVYEKISLLDVDRDFVLAIDYKMSSSNSMNNVLFQCYNPNTRQGLKLWYNNGVTFSWGTTTIVPTTANSREMIVIRHKRGDNNLTVYNSNLGSSTIMIDELVRTQGTSVDSTLVLGCEKTTNGSYGNHAAGNIYWCKVWYADLGDAACQKLVGWTHERIDMQVCGFGRYYLADTGNPCSFSLLATHLLDRPRQYKTDSGNTGGWAESTLNKFLNTRMYEAMPLQIKSLVKNVTVWSSIGNKSTDLSTSSCHITIPAIIDISNHDDFKIEPYMYEGSTISYMVYDTDRMRAYVDGDYGDYWLRSPTLVYDSYVHKVNVDGTTALYSFGTTPSYLGVLIEISF